MCKRMKKTSKYAALSLAALLLSTMLTGCSGSGSNAGVWIAVIVLVFVAVFSATSGIVYLVLQKVLPPEKPAAQRRQPRHYNYDDREDGRYQSVRRTNNTRPVSNPHPGNNPRPVNNTAPQAGADGVWICPRDKSRNTGPFCTVCGGNRPAAPRPAARPTPENAQRPARPQTMADRPQNVPAAQQPQRPQQTQRTQTNAYETAPTDYGYREPAYQPASRSASPVQQTAERPAERPEYRGAFMRQPQSPPPAQSAPSVLDTDFDSGVDSEFLESLFREVAQGNDES